MYKWHISVYFITSFFFPLPCSCGFTDFMYSLRDNLHDYTCSYIECCDKGWTDKQFFALAEDLNNNVYGQKIANEIVVNALRGHLRRSSPKSKALALSFHGKPGVGKNYISTLIVNNLFGKDYKSKYTHFYSGRIDFPLESLAASYKMNLIKSISEAVEQCPYSLFVFDEVDKMPPAVLDGIKPFIDYHPYVHKRDFRKSIFIFLSNTGGELIANRFMELWESGRKRDDLRLKDFEKMIQVGAFNEKGGFHKSETIESNLIDHYIPFLPLEEQHVKLCVRNEFLKRGYPPQDNDMKEILDEVEYGPPNNPILSNAGCKRISQKVAAYVEKKMHWEL